MPASVAPKQRPLVTVVPPPWAADHAAAAATAASSSSQGVPDEGPYTGPQEPLAIRCETQPSQLFTAAFGTYLLSVIWLIEALNYGVHVIFRPEPWNAVSVITGYALWAVQLVSLARCQLTDPGGVSSEWEAQARAGSVPASTCKRSGHLLPPRALCAAGGPCHCRLRPLVPLARHSNRLPQPQVLYTLRALLGGLLHHGRGALVGRAARARTATPRPLTLGLGRVVRARWPRRALARSPRLAVCAVGSGRRGRLRPVRTRRAGDLRHQPRGCAAVGRYGVQPGADGDTQPHDSRRRADALRRRATRQLGAGLRSAAAPLAAATLRCGARRQRCELAPQSEGHRGNARWHARSSRARRGARTVGPRAVGAIVGSAAWSKSASYNSGGAGHPQPAAPSCSCTAARWAPE